MSKKRFTLIVTALLLLFAIKSQMLSGQTLLPSSSPNSAKDWFEMMQDPNANFYDAQSAFYKAFEGRTDLKGTGYKIFKRWEYINEFRVLSDGRLQAPDYVKTQYEKYMKVSDGTKSASGNWTVVGPTAYPVNNTSQPTGMGRINAIAFHPTDPDIIFVGAPSGGFWKTIDGGSNWTNLSSDLPTLGVSSILVDPVDPDIIYLGTGDRDSDDAPGIGVYKTTDGGANWVQMNNTMGNVTVNAMVMDPITPNTIIAATSGGIFRTTDGGANWSYRLGPGNFKDIKSKPGDPSIMYSVVGTSFWRSSNTGQNWTNITSGIPSAGSRMVIGVSSADPTYVYLLQIDPIDDTFEALLRSTDSGLNFSTRSTSPNIMDYACDGSGTASQATYDLCITVDPTNADVVYVGGINNWKSTDGGVGWTIVSHWAGGCTGVSALHADQHCYEWNDGKLYVGHDGGISYTANNGGSWTEITNNLTISQIYKMGQGASNSDYVLIGCQDNGSAATTNGSTFSTTRGGDGTECIIDFSNSNYCYNTYIRGDIKRSTTGPTGSYYNTIASTGSNGIGSDETGAWVTPFTLHETDASVMFAGYENVWRCDNVKASPYTSVSWSAISAGETTTCRVLEQSPANVDILYVVRSGAMKRSDNANTTAASVTWTSCALPGGSTPTDLEAHPTDEDVIYATVDYGVYKSIDKGASWTDITGNLPALFTNCLVYDKNSNEGLYVGNQTTVWYKDADMTDWELFSEGLPPVDIRELEIYYDPVGTQDRIKAATYGRGLWESDLRENGVLNPTNFEVTEATESQINLGWELNPSNNNVVLAWNTTATFGTPVNGTSYTTSSTISGGGTVIFNGSATSFNHTGLDAETTYYYKLWSYDGSTEYSAGITANATTPCTSFKVLPFTEGFENETFPPDCWLTQRGSNGLGILKDWVRTTNNTYSGSSGVAFIDFENVLGGVAEDWMVTPGILLPPSGTTTLSFWERQNYSPDYGSLYYIKVSTNSQDDQTDFTDVLSYSEADFGISYSKRSIDLSSKNGQIIYIAFVMMNDDGDSWYIDDVDISNTSVFWTGTTSTDWNVSSNWSNNEIPSSSTNLVIPDLDNQPIVYTSNSGQCNDITIHQDAALTIQPDAALTVNGIFTNSAGASGLVIKSDATGTGSLIHSTTDVDATFERFMNNADWTNWQDGWHFLSSPMISQGIDPEFTTAPYDFYCWYEPENLWVNFKNTTTPPTWNTVNGSTNFTLGKGYMAAYDFEAIKQFTGKLNTEDVDITGLTITGTSANKSWHLLGNPFGSALTWDATGAWSLTNIGGIAKIWNEANQSYSDLSSDPASVIPATNGFFVQVTADPGRLTIPAIKRVHSDVPFYKNTMPGLILKAISLSEGNAQESRITVNPAATQDFDLMYDGEFLAGYAPQFYSIEDNLKLSTNSIPEITEQTEIILGFVKNSGSDFRIEVAGTEMLPAKAYLHDLKTGTITDLGLSPEYTFTSSEGDNPLRFMLKFGEDGDTAQQKIQAYFSNNTLNLIGTDGEVMIEIFGVSGQRLERINTTKQSVPLNLATGVYLVRITSQQIVNSFKVFVN